MPDIIWNVPNNIRNIKTVSGTQNLERNVPTTAHKNVPTNSVLLGTLFLLVFPMSCFKFDIFYIKHNTFLFSFTLL